MELWQVFQLAVHLISSVSELKLQNHRHKPKHLDQVRAQVWDLVEDQLGDQLGDPRKE